jgi:type IX secretion system PorP/SprF family membrane protein
MRITTVVVSIGLTIIGFGQQLPQYSQYHRNQIMVNPAASGIYDFIDITAGGRYQWLGFSNSPKTMYVYGSSLLSKERVRYNPALRISNGPVRNPDVGTGRIKHAIGGEVVADEYGAFRKLSFSGIYSVHLPVTDKHNLSFGTKVGLSNNAFLQDRATVLTQMNGYTGPSMIDGEYDNFVKNQSNINFIDVGAGLYFYSNNMFVGLSADQLTRDMIRFGSGTANFDPSIHFVATAGYKIPVGENLTVMPALLAKFMSPAPASVDGTLQLEYKEWLWCGVTYRHTDALVGMAGMNISQRFKLGYSYDYSLSKFNNYASGSHELILGIMLR